MHKNNLLTIAILLLLILSAYTVDLFKLTYRLADWKQFGEAPVAISHVQYFVADTPNIISYPDPALGEAVTCFEAIAFVKTDAGKPHRCCETDGRVSCLEGDFSSEIPQADVQCTTELRDIFGVPDSLAGAKEYQFFGGCQGGGFAELTVVQLDANGAIQWKHARVDRVQLATSVLRCVIGPLLLFAVFYILYQLYQERTAEPARRF
ncbi:MAG: hypothetical protein C3F07_19350 [Anaerolineales bacterium]|nr:MAG: hypothetical protein C3F07_19350 [Anaerolineales bacterium]